MIRSRLSRRATGPVPGPARPATFVVLAALVGVLASGCGGTRPPAAAPQPPVVPGESTQGPDLSGVDLPNFVMPLIHGEVSLPKPGLTPGAVTTTNATLVCGIGAHSSVPALSAAVQTAVYAAYGYTNANSHKYVTDWLVPYDLGGAAVQANIWPIAVGGTGFYEKGQTDAIVREMVCRRELTLAQAQHALETNWYSAWLRYVVSTGHI
ncbi:MAG: hypothetical protein ACRDOA_18095 [Streptosporangiaceae bacterium]